MNIVVILNEINPDISCLKSSLDQYVSGAFLGFSSLQTAQCARLALVAETVDYLYKKKTHSKRSCLSWVRFASTANPRP